MLSAVEKASLFYYPEILGEGYRIYLSKYFLALNIEKIMESPPPPPPVPSAAELEPRSADGNIQIIPSL